MLLWQPHEYRSKRLSGDMGPDFKKTCGSKDKNLAPTAHEIDMPRRSYDTKSFPIQRKIAANVSPTA